MMSDYGVFLYEGFTTSSNSMIPNKKVPARRWFGISKEMRSGGKQYEKFIRMALFKIQKSLAKFNADS